MMYRRHAGPDAEGYAPAMRELDFTAIKLFPSEQGENVTLLTVMDRPAYRIDGQTIFADNGDTLDEVNQQKAILIASQYMKVPQDKVRYLELLNQADQWTIERRGQLPLHKLLIDDADQTQLYVSPATAKLLPPRAAVVLSLDRCNSALALLQIAPCQRRRMADAHHRAFGRGMHSDDSGSPGQHRAVPAIIAAHSYSRWMRWHYLTGAFFGVITFTWVFSGMLSMEPYDVFSGNRGLAMTSDPFGGSLDMATFPSFDLVALNGFSRTTSEGNRIHAFARRALLCGAHCPRALDCRCSHH
jgi:hypothetical protein